LPLLLGWRAQPGLRLIDHMSVETLVMRAARLTMAELSNVIMVSSA